jgi:GntR family transcriptional regulator
MVTRVREDVYSRMPLAAESAELAIGEAVPVLFITRTHYARNKAVETADITIKADRMAISIDHPVGKR